MHTIVAREAGGPEVLTLVGRERPVPGPGQLLVKVAAAGVNFIDTYERSGTYNVHYPFTPGQRGSSGTVEEVGGGVYRVPPGRPGRHREGPRAPTPSTPGPGRGPGAAGPGRLRLETAAALAAAGPHRPLPGQLQLQRLRR